jgi:branched-chain amino acid transport system ATP-binding protein
MTDSALEFAGVNAWYGHAQALFGIDIHVEQAETVALLGRNGAGKTTTLRTAMGIDVTRTGDISLAGRRSNSMSIDAVARIGVGWVPEDRRIFPNLTVRENIKLAQGAARGRHQSPLSIDEVIDAVPLMAKLINRRGIALSGGEQQAVTIARALASRPTLLLLDEPTEGLAPVIVDSLTESIAELPGKLGVAILVAEQNLSFVADVASRVYVLDTGRLVHEGSAADFAKSKDLQESYLSISNRGDTNKTRRVDV